MPENNSWTSVAYGNGLWVAVAENGLHRIATSSDGINWTLRMAPQRNTKFQPYDYREIKWYTVTFGNGLWVAGGQEAIMVSKDGINWSIPGDAGAVVLNDNYHGIISYENATNWRSVAFRNGIWVAVGNGFSRFPYDEGFSNAMISKDGFSWTFVKPPLWEDWTSVTFGGDRWIAVADLGFMTAQQSLIASLIGGTNEASYKWMTSRDGTNWSVMELPFQYGQSWKQIIYGNDLYVASSGGRMSPRLDNGHFYDPGVKDRTIGMMDGFLWSRDGDTWQVAKMLLVPRRSGPGSSVSIAYGQGLWVGVSEDQLVLSQTGTEWISLEMTTGLPGFRQSSCNGNPSLAYGNGLWVGICGDTGIRATTESLQKTFASSAPATQLTRKQCESLRTKASNLYATIERAPITYANYKKSFEQLLPGKKSGVDDILSLKKEYIFADSCPSEEDIANVESYLNFFTSGIKYFISSRSKVIVCKKGKVTQKVSGLDPKCPAGFIKT